MHSRQAYNYAHFKNIRVAGDLQTAGNGFDLTAGTVPALNAVGDDTNIVASIGTTVAGATQQRIVLNGAAKTIVDGSATALFNVAIASGAMVGGMVQWLVRASNGTDHQVISGVLTYGAVNKAGTLTSTVTYATANEAKAASSGTLTLSFTAAENPADTLEIRLQPTGSLTETTYTIEYTVFPIRGTVTIL